MHVFKEHLSILQEWSTTNLAVHFIRLNTLFRKAVRQSVHPNSLHHICLGFSNLPPRLLSPTGWRDRSPLGCGPLSSFSLVCCQLHHTVPLHVSLGDSLDAPSFHPISRWSPTVLSPSRSTAGTSGTLPRRFITSLWFVPQEHDLPISNWRHQTLKKWSASQLSQNHSTQSSRTHQAVRRKSHKVKGQPQQHMWDTKTGSLSPPRPTSCIHSSCHLLHWSSPEVLSRSFCSLYSSSCSDSSPSTSRALLLSLSINCIYLTWSLLALGCCLSFPWVGAAPVVTVIGPEMWWSVEALDFNKFSWTTSGSSNLTLQTFVCMSETKTSFPCQNIVDSVPCQLRNCFYFGQ